jgi:hypothetical protein
MITRFTAVVALLLTLVLVTEPAEAARGGNSANATHCQKGGYRTVTRPDGSGFATVGECVAFAAGGGTLVPRTDPPQQLSPGCAHINNTFAQGGFYSISGSNNSISNLFYVGERITATAQEPFDPYPLFELGTTLMYLEILDGALFPIDLLSTPFPGTLTYEVPATGDFIFNWAVYDATVTWFLSCAGPA